MSDLAAGSFGDYEYLDAGDGARLERFGSYVFNRPSLAAVWRRERPELWAKADGTFRRDDSGGGEWDFVRSLPASWPLRWGPLTFSIKPTGFGHVGLFPEHTVHWPWVEARIRSAPRPCRVLHLFAYTGAMTLAAAKAGAEVCHVDAVKDINQWARQNAEASGLSGAPIRWIADDVLKFVSREIRRGRQYDAIILDPPTYGRGPGGERWILDEHLADLFDLLLKLMPPQPAFVLFTCHTPGFSSPVMRNMLTAWPKRFGGTIEDGTMVLGSPPLHCVLPCGFYARWSGGVERFASVP